MAAQEKQRRPPTPKVAKQKPFNHNYTSSDESASDADADQRQRDKFDEWTTSRRKINHTSRRIETRVSRQLVMEDGKVVADSGPQVVTRIKEDNKVEESEKKRAPNKAKPAIKSGAANCVGSDSDSNAGDNDDDSATAGRVLGEKREVQKTSREIKEENMQFRNEKLQQLSGRELHQRAISSPNELITLNNKQPAKKATSASDSDSDAPSRGQMIHYSNKAKRFQDTDEIVEIAKLALDGSVTKEVKRTRQHEEFSDEEVPDEHNEAAALEDAPTVSRTSRKHFDYVNDFDDTDTPSEHSDADRSASKTHKAASSFPRYSPTNSKSATRHSSTKDKSGERLIKTSAKLDESSSEEDDERDSRRPSSPRPLPLPLRSADISARKHKAQK